uniref:ARAD1C35530p n=1 Tax=Blastobotrys adeninivorans TaxID=409370 RepID=A0A060T395_BLAAD
MEATTSKSTHTVERKSLDKKPTYPPSETSSITEPSLQGGDLYTLDDDVLSRKMHLVNQAIDEIGFTPYHWKLFCLNGMGFAVDSLLTMLHSVAQPQVLLEFNQGFGALVCADYVGMFAGAIFWGFTADLIGRRIAFQITLFLTSIFAIAAGGGLSFVAVCSLSAVSNFAAGGNLVLDSVTFLEFLPSNKQWMLTAMALWWGLGQLVTSGVAWPFIANFSCESADDCPRSSNMGWRYTYITCGAFVLACAFARIFVIRMVETPKFDIANGNDARVIATLDRLAKSGKTTNPLTLEDLQVLGTIQKDTSDKSFMEKINPSFALKALGFHIRELFATKKLGFSTVLNFASWLLIGLIYPLFNAFLPAYLASHGAKTGGGLDITYRDNLIVTACSILGPIIAGYMCDIPRIGRRGTMVVGSLLTMAFMFAYTAVRTEAENLGISCAINVCLNIYYATLYAYTPEVMPSQHRATGNGLCVSLARIVSIVSPVVAYYGDTSSSVPMFVMAACFILLAIISALFPYEVRGKHSI